MIKINVPHKFFLSSLFLISFSSSNLLYSQDFNDSEYYVSYESEDGYTTTLDTEYDEIYEEENYETLETQDYEMYSGQEEYDTIDTNGYESPAPGSSPDAYTGPSPLPGETSYPTPSNSQTPAPSSTPLPTLPAPPSSSDCGFKQMITDIGIPLNCEAWEITESMFIWAQISCSGNLSSTTQDNNNYTTTEDSAAYFVESKRYNKNLAIWEYQGCDGHVTREIHVKGEHNFQDPDDQYQEIDDSRKASFTLRDSVYTGLHVNVDSASIDYHKDYSNYTTHVSYTSIAEVYSTKPVLEQTDLRMPPLYMFIPDGTRPSEDGLPLIDDRMQLAIANPKGSASYVELYVSDADQGFGRSENAPSKENKFFLTVNYDELAISVDERIYDMDFYETERASSTITRNEKRISEFYQFDFELYYGETARRRGSYHGYGDQLLEHVHYNDKVQIGQKALQTSGIVYDTTSEVNSKIAHFMLENDDKFSVSESINGTTTNSLTFSTYHNIPTSNDDTSVSCIDVEEFLDSDNPNVGQRYSQYDISKLYNKLSPSHYFYELAFDSHDDFSFYNQCSF